MYIAITKIHAIMSIIADWSAWYTVYTPVLVEAVHSTEEEVVAGDTAILTPHYL